MFKCIWKMHNIKPCYSRKNIFRTLQSFDLHPSVYYNNFLYARRSFHREINAKVEDRLRSEDSIGKDYRIIYRAPYLNYVRITYGTICISNCVFVPVIGSMLMTSGVGQFPVMWGNMPLFRNVYDFAILLGFSFLISAHVSYVAFKYPFRIYHNSSNGKYIAIYQHLLPWKKDKEEFNVGEMKKVAKSYSLWHDCLYEVKNRRAILFEDHFYIPQDFTNMLSSNDKEDE